MIAINTDNATLHAPTALLNYAHAPTIAHYHGTFYVAWMGGRENREGGRDQSILLSTSDDFRNWSAPVRLFDAPPGTCLFEPILFTHADTLSCLWSENHVDPAAATDDAYLREGVLNISRLGPDGWEEARAISRTDAPTGGVSGCPTISNPPLIVALPNGGTRIICAVAYLNHSAGSSIRSLYSDDDGLTWTPGEFVPSDQRKLMEGTVYPRPDGRLVMLMRNDHDFPTVWRTVSSDFGQSWENAEPTGLRSWAKTTSLVHPDGPVFMLFNDDADNGTTACKLSHDNDTNELVLTNAERSAKIWELGPCVIRQNLSVAMTTDGQTFTLAGRFDLDSNGYGCSYPAAVAVGDQIYVVSSRRDNMHTRRPNMIRAHILRLHHQHTRS